MGMGMCCTIIQNNNKHGREQDPWWRREPQKGVGLEMHRSGLTVTTEEVSTVKILQQVKQGNVQLSKTGAQLQYSELWTETFVCILLYCSLYCFRRNTLKYGGSIFRDIPLNPNLWSPEWSSETQEDKMSEHPRPCLITPDFYGSRQAISTSFFIGDLKMHSPTPKFCWAPAAADKHISWSPPPSLFLIFSGLLTVIPLPHLSPSPLLAGDSSAATLAKPLAKKAERLHRLALTCYLFPNVILQSFHSYPVRFQQTLLQNTFSFNGQ